MIELKKVGVITDESIDCMTTILDSPSFQFVMQFENFNADIQRQILDFAGDQGLESVYEITFDIDFFFDKTPAYITSCIMIYFTNKDPEIIRLKHTKKEWEKLLNGALFPYMLKLKKK